MDNPNNVSLYKKVLVIDDSDVDLMIAQLAMKKFAFAEEVVLKKSARSGLDYLLSLEQSPAELPQLIFLDINMPELSGFDFLDVYAKFSEVIQRSCVIMMLSTSLMHEDREKATGHPFVSRFLNKPLDKRKLDNVRDEPGRQVRP